MGPAGAFVINKAPGSGGGGSFTAAGDLGGNSSSQSVLTATGVAGLFALAATAANIQWATATISPTLNQADVTTNGATGATLKIQAQNATGTTATGGGAVVSSGTGTSAAGNVLLQTGGTTRVTITPSLVTSGLAFQAPSLDTASPGALNMAPTNATSVSFGQASLGVPITFGATPSTVGNYLRIPRAGGANPIIGGKPTGGTNAQILGVNDSTDYIQLGDGGVSNWNVLVSGATVETDVGSAGTWHVFVGATEALKLNATEFTVADSLVTGFFTQAMADAPQTLSAANSTAQMIRCTGANTAVRALTLTTLPTAGKLKVIRNDCTANGITVQFSSGAATATIPPGTSALVCGDGTNAFIMMTGT